MSRVLSLIIPSDWRLFKLISNLVAGTSWMSSFLVFTVNCESQAGSVACSMCAKSMVTPAVVRGVRSGVHVLTLDVNPDLGVVVVVDDPFVFKPECFLFIELPLIPTAKALEYFKYTSGLEFNDAGMMRNFLPWPVTARGVQADNVMDDTRSVFCSEAVTAFVQANGYGKMGLTPCRTTPQMLAESLITHFPESLTTRQFLIDPSKSPDLPLYARLAHVPDAAAAAAESQTVIKGVAVYRSQVESGAEAVQFEFK